MFDMVVNMPLDYLSCFAVVPRKIHGNVDICQTDYSIHSKLEFPPYKGGACYLLHTSNYWHVCVCVQSPASNG